MYFSNYSSNCKGDLKMDLVQNVKKALAPVVLTGLALLAVACGTPTPTAPTPTTPTLQIDNGIPYFGFRRPNGDYETLTIGNRETKASIPTIVKDRVVAIGVYGIPAIATLVGPSPDKSFYTVWGSCSGDAFGIGPMAGDHRYIDDDPRHPGEAGSAPEGQESLYSGFKNRFTEMIQASGVRPDCSYQSQR